MKDNSRRVLTSFAFFGPAATAVAVAIISLVVYQQVSRNMVGKTQDALYGQLEAVDQTILNIFFSAAKSANLLLFDATAGAVHPASLRQLEADIPACTRVWINYSDGSAVFGPTTTRSYATRSGLWIARTAADTSERTSLFTGPDSAGLIGHPFRDELNLDTIVPVIVNRYLEQQVLATAFIEIDLTQLLNSYLREFSAALGHSPAQVDVSVYEADGTLIDTTENLPLMRVQPLSSATHLALTPGQITLLHTASHLALSNKRYVEIYGWDERTGFVFDARVPRISVNNGVARITLSILVIGFVSVFGIVLLGLFLVRAIARMKSFEEQQVRSRLEMLQAKMHPHFLFNTLDSMVSVAARDDRDTLLRMLRALSYMLHMSIRKKEDIVTLEEELEYVSSYVQLQHVRNPDGFRYRVSVREELLDVLVYRFCIQPLVENCFVHAVDCSPGRRVRISVHVELAEAGIRVTVSDNGPGCDDATAARLAEEFRNGTSSGGIHIGLSAVHSRLRTMHGRKYGLRLLPASDGFAVQALLPRIASDVRTPSPERSGKYE